MVVGGRGIEAHGNRLVEIFGSFVNLVQHAAIGPDFGVEGAAAGVENADDIPGLAAEIDGLAEFETFVSRFDILADDQFGEAGLKKAAFDDFYVGADFKCFFRYAADLNIGVGVRSSEIETGDDHRFGTY